MEEKKEIPGLLELIPRPGFFVKDQIVTAVNSAASALAILPGTSVRELIRYGQEEYEELEEGCICLTLLLGTREHGASVTRRSDGDLFLLEQEEDDTEFRALSLASRELRMPLSNALHQAEYLLSSLPEEQRAAVASMNRSLYQMLRTIGNMSDVGRLPAAFRPEMQNLSALFGEIFDKAAALAEFSGVCLTFQPLQDLILGLADREQLERAVFNILSNALKFTPAGGHIHGALTRKGHTLRLTLSDSGSGMDREILDSLFFRYLRHPGPEDSRHGLGLGMVLIRRVAANHGGTVLVSGTGEGGTRITLTLPIRQSSETILRTPLRRPDYAGERDHGLVELADCLPNKLYDDSF